MTGRDDVTQRTRDAVVLSAAGEIDRRGFAGVPLAELLAGSAVSKGTFYFHFRSKDELASVVVDGMNVVLSQVLRRWARHDTDGLRILLGICEDVVENMCADVVVRAGMRICAEGARDGIDPGDIVRDWIRIVDGLLHRARADGVLQAHVDVGSTTEVLLGALLGQRVVAEQLEDPGSLRARVTRLWSLLLPTVATREWVEAWRPGPPRVVAQRGS